VILLQADLLDLPFRPGVFGTVLSMGMLHLFEEAAPVVAALGRCLRPGGSMYLTSLVESGRFGDRYLRVLHRAGEVAAPRDIGRLRAELAQGGLNEPRLNLEGNMAFVRGAGLSE
jgi:SAM-dependent methyltransferase